ncbi:MAG: FAD:protein FMN transferase, partial [Deltaproteobacteria bacterium]|nr:FAD:protein FMN transferase [Deltaproteobacteria bacterium]
MKRQLPIVLVIVTIFFASTGYGSRREHVISGKTMGTTYHIKMVTGVLGSTAGIKDKIDKRLLEINQSMSTYIKDSEISRFNAFERVGEPFAISEDFWKVIRVGQQLYELTQGAWDATV